MRFSSRRSSKHTTATNELLKTDSSWFSDWKVKPTEKTTEKKTEKSVRRMADPFTVAQWKCMTAKSNLTRSITALDTAVGEFPKADTNMSVYSQQRKARGYRMPVSW